MIDKVTLGDVARHIAAYRDHKISHKDLVEWARAAMMAYEIPASQAEQVIDILQDISTSSEVMMNAALRNYSALIQAYPPDTLNGGDSGIILPGSFR